MAACRATAEAEERKLEATRVFEASRIDSRGHQLRKSSRRKEQRRAIHVTLPNCGTGVQNPLTLPYVSQLHGTKQRPVLLSSSSSSFPLSFSLLSTVPFFSFLPSPGCHALDTGAVAPPQSCEQNSLENLRAQVRFETRRIPTQFAFKGRIARPKFQCTCSPHAQACEARTRA